MRRVRLAAAAGLATALLAPAAAPAVPHARLVLVRMQPLEIRGSGYRAGEVIRVTARTGGATAGLQTRSDADGSFSATLRHVTLARCSSLAIRAAGASGDGAVLLRRNPGCPERTGARSR